MKKYALIVLAISWFTKGFAQDNSPVTWTTTTRRINEKTLEVHVKASLSSGWHIYSHYQPKEAVSKPTNIRFLDNPLLKCSGLLVEIGKKEKQSITALDIEQYMYKDEVDFVQTFVLTAEVKTNISGTVTFQACTDRQCLRPQEEKFSVAVQ